MQAEPTPQPLEDIQHIRQLVERNAEFRSLSGWSLIGAGAIGLLGGGYLDWQVSEALANPARWPSERLEWRLVTATVMMLVGMFLALVLPSRRLAKHQGERVGIFSPGYRLLALTMAPVGYGIMFCIMLYIKGQYAWIIPAFMMFSTSGTLLGTWALPRHQQALLGGFIGQIPFWAMWAMFSIPNATPGIMLWMLLYGVGPMVVGVIFLWQERHIAKKRLLPFTHSPVSQQ